MGKPRGSKHVSTERKRTILDMHCMGVKQKDIVEYYGMPQSTVSNIIRRGMHNNEKEDAETRGRKPKLSKRAVRTLLKCTKKNRFRSLHSIASEFIESTGIQITTRTLRKYLHQNGVNNYVAVSKPHLSKKQQRNRMKWAKKHQMWDDSKWDCTIFSDESFFTLRPTSLRKKVWREAKTRYNASNIVPTFKSGFISLSAWAAFSAHGRTPLVKIDGTLKQARYKEILEAELIPFIEQNYESIEDVVFQQDNCGPHKAKSISTYLAQKNVRVMDWPAQSPDLNPIENAWAFLKRRLREHRPYPRNISELFDLMQHEWKSIPDSYFKNLVRSMPTRATLVKLNKGGQTKY